MQISVYFDYEVDYVCDYWYLNEDGDMSHRTIKDNYVIDGGKLTDIIARHLKSSELSEFNVCDNVINISLFDPHSGETSEYVYTIKEVPKLVTL